MHALAGTRAVCSSAVPAGSAEQSTSCREFPSCPRLPRFPPSRRRCPPPAQRKDAGESEDGFRWIDNSCFPRFNDLSQFVSYLQTGNLQKGSALGLSANLATLLAGVALVMAFLYQ